MELIAYDGYVFANGSYWAGLTDGQNIGNFTLNPNIIPRQSVAAMMTGASISVRPITATFGYSGTDAPEVAFHRLMGILDPTNTNARTLTAELNDGTVVECEAIVTIPNGSTNGEVQTLDITFLTTDPYWREVDVTTASGTFTANGAIALTNGGQARAYADYTVTWSVQRSTGYTADVGWRYRKQVTITNSTERDWWDEPMCVDIGDTASLVTGSKAQSDGDDIRIRYQGKDFYRTLVCMNSTRSFLWFLCSLKAGASATYDVVYGNSAATAPYTLSTKTGTRKTYVAFDLEGASGTATAGAGSTLTDSGKAWETDRWNGGYIHITGGTGSGQRRRISDTTATVITVARAWSTNPDNTSTYSIWMSGVAVDGGRASGAGTTTTLTDSSQAWQTNQWAGGSLYNVTKGIGPFVISSNTATVITCATMTAPALNDVYYIERNGTWTYVVDTALTETVHRDLYRENRYYSAPTRVEYGDTVPGGWQVATYLKNGDDYAHYEPFDNGSGGGHGSNYRPGLRARRRVRQQRKYKNEGNGDGLSFYTAYGLQGWYWDYRVKNMSGIGKVVFASLDQGGRDWVDMVTYTTTQSSLTDVAAQWLDLSAYDNPTRLYVGVLPSDGVEIPNTADKDDEAEVRTLDNWALWLDADAFGGMTGSRYVVGSEESVYHYTMSLRIGGGSESYKAPPYDRIVIGGTDRHLHLLSTQELVIRTDPLTAQPLAAIYTTSSGALVERVPWAIRVYRHEADIDGDDTAIRSRDFMPIPARTELITNGTFTSNITGWAAGSTSASGDGVATWSWDNTVYYGASGGSLKCATTITTGTLTSTYRSTAFATVVGQVYQISMWVRGSVAGSLFEWTLSQYNVNLATATTIPSGFVGTREFAAINTWYQVTESFTAEDTSTKIQVGISNANGTGNFWFDSVSVGLANLYVTETAMGTITVEASHRAGWYG